MMRWLAVIGMAAMATAAAAQQKPLAPLQPQGTVRQALTTRGQPLGSALVTSDEATPDDRTTVRPAPTKVPARALGASLLPNESRATKPARASALDPKPGESELDGAATTPAVRAIRKPTPAPKSARRR